MALCKKMKNNFCYHEVMKRTLLGATFFLFLVGEPTVGIASGLYTPGGFVVLFSLYILLFLFYEALRQKYSLNNVQLLLINFAVYSVLITGFLHAEIADYSLHPENTLITTLIRIQAACFPLFAYPLINKLLPSTKQAISMTKVLIWSFIYVAVLTPTKTFGLTRILDTFRIAPELSILFFGLAILAIFIATRLSKKTAQYQSRKLFAASYVLLVFGAIPLLHSFIILVLAMPIVTIIFIKKPAFRHAKV